MVRAPRLRLVTLLACVPLACYSGLDGGYGGSGTGVSSSGGAASGGEASSSAAASSGGEASSGDDGSSGDGSSGTESGLSGASGDSSGGEVTGDGTTGDPTTTSTSGDSTSTSGTSTSTSTSTSGTSTTGVDTTDSGGGDDNTTPEGVCARWNYDHMGLQSGSWTGNAQACDAGDFVGGGRESALALTNLYRWLADLPPATLDLDRSAKAQECALMMHANAQLSHSPPMSWKCYSADGASAAGKSNIATTSMVPAVDLYMVDPGNPTTIGHRRWILSNSLGGVGFGSTSGYSCMWVIGGGGQGQNQWTAWPAPGPFPIEAAVDNTGWTIQSDALSLAGAQVKITANGQDMPVKVTQLLAGYGSASAISMIPQGWKSSAGTTYMVEVTGISQPITYEVEMVSCQ